MNHESDKTNVGDCGTQTASRFGESVVLAHVNALLTVRKSPAPLVSVATSFELAHAQHCRSVSVILFGVISPRYPPEQGKMDCNMQWKDISKTLKSTTKGTQQLSKQKHTGLNQKMRNPTTSSLNANLVD